MSNVKRDFLNSFHRSAKGKLFGLIDALFPEPDRNEQVKGLMSSIIMELQTKLGKEFDRAIRRLS